MRKHVAFASVIGFLLAATAGSALAASNSRAANPQRSGTFFWISEETDFAFITREGEAVTFGEEPLELTAELSGANEVDDQGNPGVGDPDGTGSATVKLFSDQVCWSITVSNIQLPATGAHIHVGEAGVNGDIVVPLSPPNPLGQSAGCTAADAGLIADIAEDPAGYYVNVHTEEFPAGAIRGQLQPAFMGLRPGDRVFFTEDLFRSNRGGDKGARIGHVRGQCTIGLADSAQCAVTAFINDHGELHLTATPDVDLSAETATFDAAVVGGTRAFQRAGGFVNLTEQRAEEPVTTLWKVHLRRL